MVQDRQGAEAGRSATGWPLFALTLLLALLVGSGCQSARSSRPLSVSQRGMRSQEPKPPNPEDLWPSAVPTNAQKNEPLAATGAGSSFPKNSPATTGAPASDFATEAPMPVPFAASPEPPPPAPPMLAGDSKSLGGGERVGADGFPIGQGVASDGRVGIRTPAWDDWQTQTLGSLDQRGGLANTPGPSDVGEPGLAGLTPERVRTLLPEVASQLGRTLHPPREVVIEVLQNPRPTAYHTDRGDVYLTTGLIRQLASEAALLQVVAEELAQAEIERRMAPADGWSTPPSPERMAELVPARLRQAEAAELLRRAGLTPSPVATVSTQSATSTPAFLP